MFDKYCAGQLERVLIDPENCDKLHHSQSQGNVERANRDIENILRI